MVLEYWGDNTTEEELARQLETKPFGTPIFNARLLESRGFLAEVGTLSQAQLESQLERGHPVIARVWTAMLDYWDVITSHVVVVVGYDETHVFVNDPAHADETKAILWDAFLAAWAEYDETSVVLIPWPADR
jgi:uncharacterized protein YvpB